MGPENGMVKGEERELCRPLPLDYQMTIRLNMRVDP
jgi:hypothetical protein